MHYAFETRDMHNRNRLQRSSANCNALCCFNLPFHGRHAHHLCTPVPNLIRSPQYSDVFVLGRRPRRLAADYDGDDVAVVRGAVAFLTLYCEAAALLVGSAVGASSSTTLPDDALVFGVSRGGGVCQS
jgi:hypothetical protein